MAHSHLLVQHLLKQLEQHKRERSSRKRRPDWLGVFVHQVSSLFEPLAGVGRVGSICEFVDDCWEARLYLGSTEFLGGKNDGHAELVSFEIDFIRLSQVYTRLDEFRWCVSATADRGNSSFVSLYGLVDDNPVRLKVYSRPPKEAGPAFRQYSDGSIDPVSL